MEAIQAESFEKQPMVGEPQLAPSTFQEFVGQEKVKQRLQIAIDAAKQRGEPLGHVLLVGPPDFGKASLAKIVRKAIGARATVLSGTTSGNPNDFAGLLTNLEDGDVLFVEAVHALDKRVAEFLCQPMKDFKMDIMIDGGANARAVQLNLPSFTFVGTAAQTQRMLPAFLSSFQIVEEMEPYTQKDFVALAYRFAKTMRLEIDEGVAEQIAHSECASPRDVLYRLRHIQDYGHIKARSQRVTSDLAHEALKMLGRTQVADGRAQAIQQNVDQRLSVDPLRRRYQVFVSSTYEDLKEERRHVLQALLETKCIPTGMEFFPSASVEQWELIRRVIDDCDYYVVVVAGRYGSQGPEGKSYTEMEFDYAVSTGKSVIGFYHSDLDALLGSKLEKNDERRAKLAAFTAKVKQRICKPWNTPDGLASGIKSAILHAIENDRKPGWIRASDLPSAAAIASLKESVKQTRRNEEKRPLGNEAKRSIEISVTVMYYETESVPRSEPPKRLLHSFHLAADELFLLLGPRLGVRRPRRTLKMFLEQKLADRIKAILPIVPGKHLKKFWCDLDLNAVDRILDTFTAEKLVKIVRPPPNVTTKVPYWEITPKGQQRLAELRVAYAKSD